MRRERRYVCPGCGWVTFRSPERGTVITVRCRDCHRHAVPQAR